LTLMLSADESETIRLKALAQAFQQAGLAKTVPDPLLPVPGSWPFALTADDRAFLKTNKISPA